MLKMKLISGGVGLELDAFRWDCPKGIFVVVAGGGSALFVGGRTRFASGDVFFLDSQVGFRVMEGEVAAGYLLCFELAYLDYFLLQYPLARSLSLFSGLVWMPLMRDRLQVVLGRIRVLSGELERVSGFRHLKMAFCMFMLDIVGHMLVMAEPFDEGRRLMGIFKGLLEEHFKAKRRSGFYADIMCISTRKLNGLCEVWYEGKKFDEVMKDRILSEAEYLLLGSDFAIKAIAFELGFYSLQHFRGWFKRWKGVSPSVFRQNETLNN